MINELAKRRPTFQPGEPIVLMDGQTWTLPKPRVRFRRGLNNDGRAALKGRTTYGPEFDKAVLAMSEAVTLGEAALAHLEMAASMLRSNYDLTDEDIEELLWYDPEDDENQQIWADIRAVAFGLNAPKASTAGSS